MPGVQRFDEPLHATGPPTANATWTWQAAQRAHRIRENPCDKND